MEPAATSTGQAQVVLLLTASHSYPDLSAREQTRNRCEIEAIARQLDRSVAEVSIMYADVYATLKSTAVVTDYLPVLVARKVRASFQAGAASL